MLRKRLFLFAVACIMLVFVFKGNITNAEETENEIISYNDSEKDGVISNRLLNYMQKSRSNTIPVTIQICDTIDLNAIEKQVMEKNNISVEELEALEQYAYSLDENENVLYQKELLNIYDKIRSERNKLIKEHYLSSNENFINEMGWNDDEYESVGIYSPFVRNVNLSADEIYELAQSEKVEYIDYVVGFGENINFDTSIVDNEIEYPLVDDTIEIIGGNVAKNNGYLGEGVKVGVIEYYHPMKSVMGDDGEGVTLVNSGPVDMHTTMVCGIIKKNGTIKFFIYIESCWICKYG